MKLIFDQNLSHRLPDHLLDVFPGSVHSRNVLSAQCSDESIWNYAIEHDFLIVSKDSNFTEMSQKRGQPPKVIRLTIGNCTVAEVDQLVRRHLDDIVDFNADETRALLQLG